MKNPSLQSTVLSVILGDEVLGDRGFRRHGRALATGVHHPAVLIAASLVMSVALLVTAALLESYWTPFVLDAFPDT